MRWGWVAFFLLAVITTSPVLGQHKAGTVFKGRLKSIQNQTPVPYASLRLKSDVTQGAVSNAEGVFELPIQINNAKDTVVITSIGFQRHFIPASSIDFGKFHDVYLEDTVYTLKEIYVLDVSPKDMIVKAMAKVDDNFYKGPCEMEAFYRQSVKEDDIYVKLNEAVLRAFDTGFDKPMGVKLDYTQLRRSYDPRAIKPNPIVPANALFHHYNLVRAKTRIMECIKNDYWEYEVDRVTYQGDQMVYVVSAKAKDEVDLFVFDIIFYILPSNFEIIRFDYDGLRKLARFPTEMTGAGGLGLKLHDFKGTYLFESDGSKLFMKYLQVQLSYQFFDRKTNQDRNRYYENSELVVFDRKLSFTGKVPAKIKNLESVDIEYDPVFWNAFVVADQIPRDPDLLPNLNRKVPLEAQFKESNRSKNK